MIRLYSYFRSSAAYRVRIALALKGIPYHTVPVHLLRGGGEQFEPGFRALNPAAAVPVLDAEGIVLTQSLAIVEYLEETHPDPPLLPSGAVERARVRALALAVACDIHPLNNLRVLAFLERELGADAVTRQRWVCHWVHTGLSALEAMLAHDARTGRFCQGDAPTLADCCLVPQVFNALRFGCDLGALPTVRRIYDECTALAAFRAAAPGVQPDAEQASREESGMRGSGAGGGGRR